MSSDTASVLGEKGSFLFLPKAQSLSAFNGVCFFDQEQLLMRKAIHTIRFLDNPSLAAKNGYVLRQQGHKWEKLFFHEHMFCYHANGQGEARISLDLRNAANFSTDGREHTFTQVDKHTVKVSTQEAEFLFISTKPIFFSNTWVEMPTPYDQSRGSRNSWWVVDGLRISVQEQEKLVVCFPDDEEKARRYLEQEWQYDEHDHNPAFLAAQALQSLVIQTHSTAGILAGFPWFHQIWSRDEAIAVGGLFVLEQFDLAARILLRSVQRILPDGRVSNRFPASDVGSADGVGWVFFRLEQLFSQGQSSLSAQQWKFVYKQLCTALSRLPRKELLVINNAQETWMDTIGGVNDFRDGARIEIQALTLSMMRFCKTLAKQFNETDVLHEMELQETKLRDKVREVFLHDRVLADGFVDGNVDFRIRSNIFLAAHVYPELLQQHEWKEVLWFAVEKLFLSWGAISSLDTSDPLFCSHHSGQNDRSYHRGDTWYFVNNIAAMVLLDCDESFRDVVLQIYEASKKDLMQLGAIGCPSEISSANSQIAFGCWSQAWSASTFVELAKRLH